MTISPLYMFLLVLLRAPNIILAVQGLSMSTFENSAMYGAPKHTSLLHDLSNLTFSLENQRPFSTEVTGTMRFIDDEEDAASLMYAFACNLGFEDTSSSTSVMGFLWIGDHLICHSDPYPFSNSPNSMDGSTTNPLNDATIRGGSMPIVLHVYYDGKLSTKATWTFALQWALLKRPNGSVPVSAFEAIPSTQFDSDLPALEIKRRELQNSEKTGWNLWSYNMLSAVRLPESCSLTTSICQISSGVCLFDTHIEDTRAQIRVGNFAADRTYWQYYVAFGTNTTTVNVSLSFARDVYNDALRVLVEPQECDTTATNCSDFAIVAQGSFLWGRAGGVTVSSSSSSHRVMTLAPAGLEPVYFALVTEEDSSRKSNFVPSTDLPHLTINLGSGAFGIAQTSSSIDPPPGLSDLKAFVTNARAKDENATNERFGSENAEVKQAVSSAVMWNYIYHPAEYGPFLPVSRSWNFVKSPSSDEWSYVIFDWDNFFASYMASLDPRSKNVSYSNLIQVVRSRTAKGFVPNYSAGGGKSLDRTEPPIGAHILEQMYNKYNDSWIVELLFDDLKAWNDWFLRERALGPLGIVSLGSDLYEGYEDSSAGTMQGARYESGLDNSPMYDGDFFEAPIDATHSDVGQMQLYDVGMASMFVAEARALANLARVVLRREDLADTLDARAEQQSALIRANLWDEEGNIYTNRFWNASGFYRRISPTSFYAMLAKAATDEQAETMVNEWLLNPKKFCVSPNGDFEGNDGVCWWGLPSINRADAAYPPLGYWRGFVWGPMAQLTYWSLAQYDHLDSIRKGRKALCAQMRQLMLSQWRQHRHICENYSPHRAADTSGGDCTGTKFYHWGALTGMIGLIEDGKY